MQKIAIVLSIIILACGSFKVNLVNTITKNEETKNNTVSKSDSIGNPYFKESYFEDAAYTCYFLTYKEYRGFLSVKCEKLLDLVDGQVYGLRVKGYIPDDLEFPQERLLLGYLYVKKDKIYRIPEKDESLKQLKKGQMPEGSYIVCQDKGIKDSLKEEEKGIHHYLKVNDEIESHYYRNIVETDYFETFTWKKDEGLTYYCSGYGALSDYIKLKKIETETETE